MLLIGLVQTMGTIAPAQAQTTRVARLLARQKQLVADHRDKLLLDSRVDSTGSSEGTQLEVLYTRSIALDALMDSAYVAGSYGLFEEADAYLFLAVECAMNMIASAEPYSVVVRGRTYTYEGWRPLLSDGRPSDTQQLQVARSLMRVGSILLTADELTGGPELFLDEGATLVCWVGENIVQAILDRYGTLPWLAWTYMSDRLFLIAELSCSLIEALPRLQWFYLNDPDLPKRATYMGFVTAISAKFRRHLRVASDGGYIWDVGRITVDPENLSKSPDSAHAGRAAQAVINMYRCGLGGWTRTDIQRFATALTKRLWNQNRSYPLVANYITGSNVRFRNRTAPGSNGLLVYGWSWLAEYSLTTRTLCDAILVAPEQGRQTATTQANGDAYYKKITLVGHLLRGLEGLWPEW